MGYAATEILIDLMQGKSLNNRIREVPTRLIIRDSCRAIT
jgi:DNA-binding LacI/PurR family transcriptional regulator